MAIRFLRRRWLAAAFAAALVGCAAPQSQPPAAPATARATLAPTGKLRVGLYRGSPTSLVNDRQGQPAGVAHDLGRELARRLDVPFEPVQFRRLSEVIDAVKRGEVDFTFTNASPARARDVLFTAPLLNVELGYLVPQGSSVRSLADVDRAGVRVGVSEGSSSQAALGREYRHARLVPAPSLDVAGAWLRSGQLDAFATNKGILHELADSVPGSRILDGRWGMEHMAIAVPKGREAALPYLNDFAAAIQREGVLKSALARSGLRGAVEAGAP